MSAQLMEVPAIVATIDPAVQTVATHDSDVVDMKSFRRAIVVVGTGAYTAAGSTLNVTVYANTANSASGGTAITGKTFTSSTFSGSAAGQAKQGVIVVTADEMEEALAGARYLYAEMTVGTNTINAALFILADNARYEPATDNDLASVAEIIN